MVFVFEYYLFDYHLLETIQLYMVNLVNGMSQYDT